MNTNRHGLRAWLGPPGPRAVAVVLCAMLLSACAESDPYKRLEPGLTDDLTTQQIIDEYNRRWPKQFKSVQTVTIDFGPITKTFGALLIVQRPGKFRLQGMTEQGIKIFELAHDEQGDHVLFKADEMSDETIASISRDIQRVFLAQFQGVATASKNDAYYLLEGNTATSTLRIMMVGGLFATAGISIEMAARDSHMSWPDRVEMSGSDGRLFCLAQYEWGIGQSPLTKTSEGRIEIPAFYPSVIVLRDSGRESKSYPYKLTIKITELTVRDTPWPEKTFKP